MNLPIKFARRYLFAKRSTNAINIITGITVLGLTIGTAALILVLSVFNGLEDLLSRLMDASNPDIKVMPAIGKVFETDPAKLAQIKELDGVDYVSETLEEIAFFQYRSSEDVGILKGVDEHYHKVTSIDSSLFEGDYLLTRDNKNFAILGMGMRRKLGVNIDDQFNQLTVYMAKRKRVGPLSDPFKKQLVIPRATFNIQPDYDQQYILSSIDFARRLLEYDKEVSFLEIRLNPAINESITQQQIQEIMGPDFLVKNRYQQDEAFNKIMNTEKWMSYAISVLTLFLIAFNMIGSLWMIVLDKKKDISILKSMGATDKLVRNIFLNEGLLLSILGMVLGFLVAIILYVLQKVFGIIPSPGFIEESYPVLMHFPDFIVVALTVLVVGGIASIAPALKAASIPAIVREE